MHGSETPGQIMTNYYTCVGLHDIITSANVYDCRLRGMSLHVLRNISSDIASPVAIIFRKSLDTGCIPHDWRTANVTPLFKKGNRSQAENYRPVGGSESVFWLLHLLASSPLQHCECVILL